MSRAAFIERPTCDVCGCPDRVPVVSKPFLDPTVWTFLDTYYEGRIPAEALEGAQYEISRCTRCGFLWQRWVLDDQWLGVLYEQWITPESSHASRRSASSDLYAGYARDMLLLSKLIGKKPADIAVLDFGMGWGTWSLMAKAFGYQSFGHEISPERITFAREQGIAVLKTLENIPNRFDVIVSEQCFEHIPRPREALGKLAGLLLPGGILRISVPDARRSVGNLSNPNWTAAKDAFHPLEHVNAFTHQTLLQFGRGAGLTPIGWPLFPMVATNPVMLLRSCVAPLWHRFRSTHVLFRKLG